MLSKIIHIFFLHLENLSIVCMYILFWLTTFLYYYFCRICKTSKTVYVNAVSKYNEGDEELSCIYFMKYLSLIEIIRKHHDYAKEKNNIKNYLSKSDVTEAIDVTEQLHKSLSKRYEVLNVNQTNNRLKTPLEITEDLVANLPTVPTEDFRAFLTPKELFEEMKTKEILVVDCRSSDDFQNSKLVYQHYVNIPEEIIYPGKSAGMLQSTLSMENMKLWASRMIMNQVLLMDWNTNSDNLKPDTTIWILENILRDYDPDCNYKSLKFLKGGYEDFIITYPTLCTNPLVRAPTVQENDFNVGDIEYPSFNDISMKEDLLFNDNKLPKVNRATKQAAIKTYEKSKKAILQEEEQLMDKSLNIERERLEVETNLVQTLKIESDNNVVNEDEQIELKNKTQELEYKRMQLEDQKRDIVRYFIILEILINIKLLHVFIRILILQCSVTNMKNMRTQRMKKTRRKKPRRNYDGIFFLIKNYNINK